MTITQKIEREYFARIVAGDKRDLRFADGVVHEGDTVIIEEWDPHTHTHTGRKLETVVTAVRTIPVAADWAAQEREGETLQVVQFEPKESKYTPAS